VLSVSLSGGTGLTAASADALVTITASVPFTAPYQNKSLLNLSSVMVNNASAAGVSGVQLAAYLGDVLGTGLANATDASLVDQVGSGAGTGFNTFKDLDPSIIGGVDGGAFVNATDASLINEAGSGATVAQIPSVPTLPEGVTLSFGGPDPYLHLSAVQGSAGQTVTETLYLDITDPNGVQLTALDEAIGFDVGVLRISNVRSAAGLAALGSYATASTVDNTTGVLLVGQAFMGSGLPPVVPYGTEVAVLQFDVTLNADVSLGAITGLTLLQSGTVNGQLKYTTISDNKGALTFTPGMAPSNSGNAAIDGSVTVVPVTMPVAAESVVSEQQPPAVVQPRIVQPVRRIRPVPLATTIPVNLVNEFVTSTTIIEATVSLVVPSVTDGAAPGMDATVIGTGSPQPLVAVVQLGTYGLIASAPVASPESGLVTSGIPNQTRPGDIGASLSLTTMGANKVASSSSVLGTSGTKPATFTLDEMYRQWGTLLGGPSTNGVNTDATGDGTMVEDLDDLWAEEVILADLDARTNADTP
jgi:hypothetical protein